MESGNSTTSLPSLEEIEIIYGIPPQTSTDTSDFSDFSSEEENGGPRFLQPRRRRNFVMEPVRDRPAPRDPAPTIILDWDRELVLPTHNLKLAWGHTREAFRAVLEALRVVFICARLGIKIEEGPALRPDVHY